MIYLDNNATTRPSQAVVDAMCRMLSERWHNPSSAHRAGQLARQSIDLSRLSVAKLINAKAREIVFTSGGTEAINLAIRGALAGNPRRVVVTCGIEHEAVRGLCHRLEHDGGAEVRWAPVGPGCVVDIDHARALIDERVALVSIMWANNETGAIQPIERIGELAHEAGALFHVDATQWVGKMPTDVRSLPIDLMSFSAHKFHGPKGAGALYIRQGVRLRPVQSGSQELDRRGGTENAPGIVGMGIAADEALKWVADPSNRERVAALRDRFEALVRDRIPEAVVNCVGHEGLGRLYNTSNVGFPRLEADALHFLFSEAGLCVSTGSACSSGSLDPSPVLCAMHIPDEIAHGSIRFSLSRDTTEQDVEGAVEIIAASVAKLKAPMHA